MDVGSVRQYDFEVVLNERVAEGTHRLVIRSDVAREIRPGQFMNLQVPGNAAHILRIPLSFASADADAGTVELLYAVVGEGTQRLSQMAVGDTSTLLGPCGKGWRLPATPGRVLLVAGGIGLPPVLAAARMVQAAGCDVEVVAGVRTATMLVPDVKEWLEASGTGEAALTLCTDDGSAGVAGLTTDVAARLMAERSFVQVYTCGPNVMMAGVARLAREAGVPCQVSMERMMGCGFGACSCCNVALASGGYALCCQDGPVFDAEEVAW